MKKIFFGALLVVLQVSCNSQANTNSSSVEEESSAVAVTEDNTAVGVIEFENSVYDFGTIKEGKVVEHIFKFKNIGNAPVILAQVSASCGCTTPDYSKEPILPGKEGEVKVSFDSKGQLGKQQKIVTVSSNAERSVTTVQLTGTVEK